MYDRRGVIEVSFFFLGGEISEQLWHGGPLFNEGGELLVNYRLVDSEFYDWG